MRCRLTWLPNAPSRTFAQRLASAPKPDGPHLYLGSSCHTGPSLITPFLFSLSSTPSWCSCLLSAPLHRGPCLYGHCSPGPQPCHRASIQEQPPTTEQNTHQNMEWSIKQNPITQYELNSPGLLLPSALLECFSKVFSSSKRWERPSHLIPFVHKSVKASAERMLKTFTKGGGIHVSCCAGSPQLTLRHSCDDRHPNLNYKKVQKDKIHCTSWSMQQ